MFISYIKLRKIKRLNLPDIVKSYGIALKHNGNSSYQGLCPFHNDRNPSLSISKKNSVWLWHCFGCHAKGTVIDFVIKKENINFQQAYKKLSSLIDNEPLIEKIHQEKTSLCDFNPQSLLNETTNFYHNTFKEDRRGLNYLIKRGIRENSIYLDFKIGFVNGSLKKTLPDEGPMIDSLKKVGLLNQKGNDFFYNCVVFPIFDEDGNTISLYGRNIERKQHLYLPGPHKGVFNSKALRISKRIFLTESIIDCLSLYKIGIKEAISLYGTGGLTADHIELFKKYRTNQVYFCLDNDASGNEASKNIAERLSELGIKSYRVTLPDKIKDLNDYLLSGKGKEDFDKLVQKAHSLDIVSADLFSNDVNITEDDTQIIFDFKDRSYRVRGLTTQRLDQLKVNVKLTNKDSYHLDTFDLYSAKYRQSFTSCAKKVLNLEPGIINSDLALIVDHLENIQAKMLEEKTKPKDRLSKMSESEKIQAEEFLKDPNLLERIIADFKACGYVGEENNLLLGYFVSISRKLSTPLAMLIISRSAAGKSTLQNAILEFTPPEDYEKYTRLTDQALFYKEENALKYKLLAIEEEKGAHGAAYSVRNLQSAGGLRIAATIKDPQTGKFKTDVYVVYGPTSIMITTTYYEDFDYETYNRFIIITIDESINQTRLILERQRLDESVEGIILKREREKIKRLHHSVQRLLRPLEVANPYSGKLTFIDSILRARREQPKYLNIIKAVVLLRQYQKEIKTYTDNDETFEYIEVDLNDIEIANRIANEILGRSLDEMSPPSRRLLTEIKKLVDKICQEERILQDKCIISRRDIREFTKWSDYQIRTHIKELEELEYLIPVCGSQGKRFTYILVWDGSGSDGSKFLTGLIDIEKLRGEKSNYEGT